MPNIEIHPDAVGGAKLLTVADALSAFHQLPLADSDQLPLADSDQLPVAHRTNRTNSNACHSVFVTQLGYANVRYPSRLAILDYATVCFVTWMI